MIEVSCSDRKGLAEAGKKIKNDGRIVVFPTDTVYGLGANPFLEAAVQACFKLKGRSEEKSVPILFSDISTIKKYVEFDSTSDKLANAFWPGAVTLVLKLRENVTASKMISKNGDIAVRIPDNACCIELIRASGGSLIGTSANRSSEPACSDPDDSRLRNFAANCDYFVMGECSRGISSTVLRVAQNGKIRILREGAVPLSDIVHQLGNTSRADLS